VKNEISVIEFNAPSSAYVHIPFCRRRCFYCDFPISVVGDQRNGNNSGTIAYYVKKLCEEISLTPHFGKPLKTIFFGGGTPSLLSVAQLNLVLEALDRRFGILKIAEISMEIDPGTFDFAQIQGYKSAGVNRFSLGVQAFQSELLKACGRTHTVEDVYASVDLIQRAEIENYSLDLISGLPHQTLEQWQDSLTKAIALSPKHLSTYDLTIEPQTPFGKQFKPGVKPLPDDELTADMYRMAQRVLIEAGYQHYEISNYARSSYQCQHNRVYWENRSFYGFGMGATSYIKGNRFARPRKTREYYEWIESGIQSDPAMIETEDLLLDTLMVGLRLAEGLDMGKLIEEFGQTLIDRVWKCLQPYQKVGWITVDSEENLTLASPRAGRLRLTDPEGFLFSNVVLVKLFEAFEEDV
jgi:oxygen-independent coproporphyrinogen-3 oxidase